jgi:iron complex outermembrane receptor protein
MRKAALVAAAIGAATYSMGSAAAQQADGPASDQPIQLEPINVEGRGAGVDVGYVARQGSAATKTDTPLLETPQSISVITRTQLDQQGAQSVKQALGYTAGVASNTRAGFAGFDIMYSRGFILDRYLDGTRLLGGANYTAPQIEAYGVQQYEVFRGPASVLYGQSSPGGLVNAVTKRPTDYAFGEIQGSVGIVDRWQGAFDFGGPVNEDKTLLYRFTGLARTADSQVDFTKQERFFFAPAVTWRPNDYTSLTVMANVQHDPHVGLYSVLPAAGTLFSDPNGKIPRRRYLGDPDYNSYSRDQQSISYAFEHRFDDVWTVRQNFRYMHVDGETEQVLPLLRLSPTSILRYALYDKVDIDALTLDNQVQAKFDTGPMRHTFLAGLDYQRLAEGDKLGQALASPIDVFNPIYGPGSPRPPIVSSTMQKTNQVGLYAQDQMKFDRFALTLSGRQDWVDIDTRDRLANTTTKGDEHAFTWRAGFAYVFDSGLAPYVSYAKSFQPAPGVSASGAAFKPTTGEQYEAGVKFEPVGINASLTLAAFHLTQQNVVTSDPATPALRTQVGEIRSRGFEAEAKARLFDGLDLLASYTHADVEVTKSLNPLEKGGRPVNVPQDMASVWAFYTLSAGAMDGLGFGGGVRYVGKTAGDVANTFFTKSNTLVDAALKYDFGRRWRQLDGVSLDVNVWNLFDKRYVSECTNLLNCVYGPGRTAMATLKYRW